MAPDGWGGKERLEGRQDRTTKDNVCVATSTEMTDLDKWVPFHVPESPPPLPDPQLVHKYTSQLETALGAWCWLLAAEFLGYWLLAAGCWLLAASCWLLAAGC